MMNEDAVAELQCLALLDGPAPVLLRIIIKLSPAEGIGGEQAVSARVPGGRMPETPRAIEYRDAQLFSADCPVIVDPIRRFSPNLFFPFRARRVDHVAGGRIQLFGQADAEGAFFGVTQHHVRAVIGDQGDFTVDPAGTRVASENERLDLLGNHPAARTREVESGLKRAGIRAALHIVQLLEYRPSENCVIAVFRKHRLAPEIDAVDISVPEEHGALMRLQTPVLQMLGRNSVSDGKVARHHRALRAAQGLKVGLGDVGGKIVGREGLPLNAHFNAVALPAKFDRVSRGPSCGGHEQPGDRRRPKPGFRKDHHQAPNQNVYFSANWRMRGPASPKSCPNVASETTGSGALKLTWFARLKNSNRNSTRWRSVILKYRLTAASISK